MIVINTDPIAFSIGNLDVYWYGILFAVSIIIAWTFANTCVKRISEVASSPMTLNQLDKFIFGSILITVGSARLGHVLFFEFSYYLKNPIEILMLRNGGLSFHGGLVGMIIYTWFYCGKNNIPKLFLADILCLSTSLALVTGRVANFVNQELVGKVWASEYGVIFKAIDNFPRYPTQIYEAMTEGLLTFIILSIVLRTKGWTSIGTGTYSSLFCIVYSSSRFVIEFFKDVETVSFRDISLTIGQILCIGMFVLGMFILLKANRRAN